MRQLYLPVCSIAQQHHYFQQPQTTTVRIAPTHDTARNLQRAGLLVKATPNALVVLRAIPQTDSEQASNPTPALPSFLFPLRFAIMPSNPYFGNITELPDSLNKYRAEGARSILFFQAIPPATAGCSELKPEQALTLPLTPLTVNVPLVPNAQPGEAITDLKRQTVLPASMQKSNATGISLDLHPWGAGYYELQQGGQELLNCYADDQLYVDQAWGVLHVEEADLQQGPLIIQFMFQARRTRWRYLISYRRSEGQALPIPQGATIQTKTGNNGQSTPVSFTKVSTPPPATGADVVFESTEALALAERPSTAFCLHYTMQGAPMEIALPAASGTVLYRPTAPVTVPPGSAFSEIVVLL
jgi:hypothetical protein